MPRSRLLALLLLLAACQEKKPQVQVSDALPIVPVPPASRLVSKEAGEDAMTLRFSSTSSVEDVMAYYRFVLAKAPWTIKSDSRMADSTMVLYAVQPERPPLWVRVRRGEGGVGSVVDITGARVEQTDSSSQPRSE